MKCESANEQIMKYYDRELNDIEVGQLKQHLKGCKKCEMEFQELSEIIGVLESNSFIELPQDFEINVMSKIRQLDIDKKKKRDRLLIYIYSFTSVIFLGLAMMLVGYLQEISIIEVLGELAVVFKFFVRMAQFIASAQAGFIFYGVLIAAFAILLMYLGIIVFMDVNVGGIGDEGKK